MKTIEIFEDENSIKIDETINDEHNRTDYKLFPQEKKFEIRYSIIDANAGFYGNSNGIYEYKISNNPIEIHVRLLEKSSGSPEEYSVKDGVVLESEMTKESYCLEETKERIISLKKEVEWNKLDLSECFYTVAFFILFKHPEIVSKEDYRKFLRQSAERIKTGILKIEEALKKETNGLQINIIEGKNDKYIWYPDNEANKKEMNDYYDLPEEKRKGTNYEKKLKYAENFTASLFKIDSPKHIGMSKDEFRVSSEILDHINSLLNKRGDKIIKKKIEDKKRLKTKGIIISFFLTLFISWILSLFVDISPFLIFILVQIVAFFQSIIGGWIGKIFE